MPIICRLEQKFGMSKGSVSKGILYETEFLRTHIQYIAICFWKVNPVFGKIIQNFFTTSIQKGMSHKVYFLRQRKPETVVEKGVRMKKPGQQGVQNNLAGGEERLVPKSYFYEED